MSHGRLRLVFFAGGLLACAGTALAVDAPAASEISTTTAATFTGKAGTFPDETVKVGTEERVYRLVVPDTVNLNKPAPLIFAFHGMGEDNKDHMAATSGLNDVAAEHKFIIVYPSAAASLIPNTGLVKAWALTLESARHDLDFFDALLTKLQSQYRIDANAIYITGMSNGAYFAHLVARERSDKIAALAAHSGELGQIDLGLIATGRKFPVLIIHGAADTVFPLQLAQQARDLYTTTGHPVKYVEIPNWGHAWDQRMAGQIWDFFSSHPLLAPAAKDSNVIGTPIAPSAKEAAPPAMPAPRSTSTPHP